MYLKNIIEKCLLGEQTALIGAYRSQRNRLRKLESRVFKKYQRKEVSFTNLIKGCFLAVISTRRVGEVLEDVIGYKVSAQTVSNIAKELDCMVKKYHNRPLADNYRYLFFDAINLRVKSLANHNKKTVLVAYGITTRGVREIIDFMIAESESETSWYMFVDNLYRRGLKGSCLDLITIDGNRALKLAISTVYPFTPVQRCWVHKLANITSKLPKKAYSSCLTEAKLILQQRVKRRQQPNTGSGLESI